MKLGIALSTFPTRFGPIVLSGADLRANVELAAGLGYQGLDLFMDSKTDEEIDRIAQLLSDNGMEVAMFIAIFLAESGTDLSDGDEESRLAAVERFKEQVIIAGRMSARTMPVGFIRGNPREGEGEKSYYDRLARSMRELVEFAAPRNITLCLEPINRYEMKSVHRVEQAVEFIETYGVTGLKILPDLFHMNIEEVSIAQALQAAGSRIGHVHIADSNRRAPGQGHLDYRTVLDTLSGLGFDGYLSIEAFPRPSGEECARQGAAYMNPLLDSPGTSR